MASKRSGLPKRTRFGPQRVNCRACGERATRLTPTLSGKVAAICGRKACQIIMAGGGVRDNPELYSGSLSSGSSLACEAGSRRTGCGEPAQSSLRVPGIGYVCPRHYDYWRRRVCVGCGVPKKQKCRPHCRETRDNPRERMDNERRTRAWALQVARRFLRAGGETLGGHRVFEATIPYGRGYLPVRCQDAIRVDVRSGRIEEGVVDLDFRTFSSKDRP